MAIQFFFKDQKVTLMFRTALKKFVNEIFITEGKRVKSLDYVFCSDEYLLDINRTHLKHNFYTDTITFNLSETPLEIIGEIYISVERVRDNAAGLGISTNEELHRVIFHGVLHLCGYNDKSSKDQKEMRAAEDKYLRLYLK
ncbi:rRNA maturation RNase YbeY [Ferruginibacter sp.]|uniref:rRNA maturation RNase YbeY n=1 Tax=Ferruginibacter sp. TaxID=1940288 RepID=UPI0026595F00|nr:rRNA maturation RNase YbeY [Ferruginibacter sp.]